MVMPPWVAFQFIFIPDKNFQQLFFLKSQLVVLTNNDHEKGPGVIPGLRYLNT